MSETLRQLAVIWEESSCLLRLPERDIIGRAFCQAIMVNADRPRMVEDLRTLRAKWPR